MHILLGLLSAIGIVGIIIWRIRMTVDVAREVGELAGDTRALVRRSLWRRKLHRSPAASISDPREAAAAMMVAVAENDGALTDAERRTIIDQMVNNFAVKEQLGEELLAHARWLARDAGDLTTFLKRLSAPIKATCSETESRDLIDMLHRVGSADHAIGDDIAHSLTALDRHLNG